MSKKNRKKKSVPDKSLAYPWFPNCIDIELIPAIRSLGKSGISVVVNENGQNGLQCSYSFGKTPETLNEKIAFRGISDDLLLVLTAVLAEGPKMFVVPTEMVDDLQKIEIPLKVSDYTQPFPAVIVKNQDEYHFVVHLNGRLFFLTAINGVIDCCRLLHSEEKIERYLVPGTLLSLPFGDTMTAQWKLDVDVNAEHRFRSTLNFLLMVTAGGFVRQVSPHGQRTRRNKSPQARYTEPEMFAPQDVALWRDRIIAANRRDEDAAAADSQGTESNKRVHWRRAHWRRVATGEGRTQRELRLIPCCLVNKRHLTEGDDPSQSEYTMS